MHYPKLLLEISGICKKLVPAGHSGSIHIYSSHFIEPPPEMPRSQEFWTEYEKLSTVLSILRSGPFSLEGRLGLAEFEIVSPCNPDTLYLRILIETCVVLFYDVLGRDGDKDAQQQTLNAAREVAKLTRVMRTCGKSPGETPPGTHEIHAPFILNVSRCLIVCLRHRVPG